MLLVPNYTRLISSSATVAHVVARVGKNVYRNERESYSPLNETVHGVKVAISQPYDRDVIEFDYLVSYRNSFEHRKKRLANAA